MRSINKELTKYNPRKLSIAESNRIGIKNILKSNYPFVYCPECGEKMLNDYGRVSRHFREKHIKERSSNADRGYRFHPIPS